jgi:hypothetical protein
MLPVRHSPRRNVAMLLLALAAGLTVAAASSRRSGPRARPPASCTAPEFRQFDFFAGDWDTYDVGDSSKVVARNRVTSVLGGCALREVYEQGDGLLGESLSIYDASRRQWHQSWFTNRGGLLLLDGGLEGDRIVLTGEEKAADGTSSLLRAIWRRQERAVRETAERSTDGGRTWAPVFDIVFRPHG